MTCAWCDAPIKGTSRKRFCNDRCRVASHREGRRTPPAPPSPQEALERTVAALYVRLDGPYPQHPHVDAWDILRRAEAYDGPHPVIAHPPCGPWGAFRHNVTSGDAWCAVKAVAQVRRWGGVLEHPSGSHLWRARGLPKPGGGVDRWGGWSMLIRQRWWGHPAAKPTWLYIVGRDGHPPLPPFASRDSAERAVMDLSRRERELTPVALADWLVMLAQGCVEGRYRRGCVLTSC